MQRKSHQKLFSNDVKLPDKDRPVPLAAIGAGATHLLTGDFQHFGPYYGERIEAVLILPPGEYLSLRAGESDLSKELQSRSKQSSGRAEGCSGATRYWIIKLATPRRLLAPRAQANGTAPHQSPASLSSS